MTADKIISLEQYNGLENVNEFLLYTDNILEGINLLDGLAEDEYYLSFFGVVYQPMDQPVYIFSDGGQKLYAIKVCGSFNKWVLPEEVAKIINFVDLPDYVFYSIKSQKVILAGENTETASVGNSQWQREGRKLGAARIGVPFIYQTFYSGRDESQDTVREPSSLQVYNHLLYSVRYHTPSFVAYLESNFLNSHTRVREKPDAHLLLSKYIKTVLMVDVDPSLTAQKKQLEKDFYLHMIDYLKEPKSSDLPKTCPPPRLKKDFLPISARLYRQLITDTDSFIDGLVDYLYETDGRKISEYKFESELLKFDEARFVWWSAYDKKAKVSDLLTFLKANGAVSKTYITRSAKIGIANTLLCKAFLLNKFPGRAAEISAVLDDYTSSIIMPLRIHKRSNGSLTYSPDPESGEVVAFSELFSLDINGRKKRPVIGYCTVDTPANFTLRSKAGTKLYKALAEYVDILIINNRDLFINLPNNIYLSNCRPESIADVRPLATTEERAVVSAYLNQTVINSNWKLCFIHTHHSSWQQMVIHSTHGDIQQKIDRVSTKVDLILQHGNKFLIAEGKDNYIELLTDKKIRTAMMESGYNIDRLFGEDNRKYDAFIYNMTVYSNLDIRENVRREAENIAGFIRRGAFRDKAFHDDFVVIMVYVNGDGQTKFKLVYSPGFDQEFKARLDSEFLQ